MLDWKKYEYILKYVLTSWSWDLSVKLTVSQLVRKFPTCRTQSSLPHVQELTTCPYPEPNRSSLCPQSPSRKGILKLSSHLRLGLESGLLPSGFPIKTLYAPLFSPYVLHALSITLFLSSSSEKYLMRSTYHKTPRYIIITTAVLPLPS
jgi:hypothetical protein